MSERIETFVGVETVETIGFVWGKPSGRSTFDTLLRGEYVAVSSNVGWLVLLRLEKFTSASGASFGVRSVPVKPSEMPEVDL